MKIQLKIIPFFAAVLFFTAVCFWQIGFQNNNDRSNPSYDLKRENESVSGVEQIIENVKAPTYFTVFNVILNYLPLKK